MKTKCSYELKPNEELWQPDPFREPRAWALAWDVAEMLRREETSAVAVSGLVFPADQPAWVVREETDAGSP